MARKNPFRRMISTAVVGAAMFIFPFAVSSQSKPLKQIYVGVSSVSMGNIIIYVTKEAKLFEKYGPHADPVAMRGSGESSKAMIGGRIQVAPIATPTVINAGLSGSDLVILGHTLPGGCSCDDRQTGHQKSRGSQRQKGWRHHLWFPHGFLDSPYSQEEGAQSGP